MQFKKLIAITYALTAASIAIGISADFMQSFRDQTTASLLRMIKPEVPPQETFIVGARRDLPAGHQLTPDDLQKIVWPLDSVPLGMFTSIDAVFQTLGEPRLSVPLSTGEPLMAGKLAARRDQSAMSSSIPSHMRAVTIRVDREHNVNGLVQPKDRVDVLLTARQPQNGKSASHFTSVVVQGALVLAIGQDPNFKAQRTELINSVTVAVSPENAAKLALAATVGSLSLALKSPLGSAVERAQALQPSDLQPRMATDHANVVPKIVVFRTATPTTYHVTARGAVRGQEDSSEKAKAAAKTPTRQNAPALN